MRLNRPDYSPYGIDVPGRELGSPTPERHTGPDPSRVFHRQGRRMRTSDFCFIFSGLAALSGMSMGIAMGILQDFTLSPAHAHLNLLGWVTMALYGLYHRGTDGIGGWLGWTQVISGALGAVMMSGGLAVYLGSGDDSVVPLVMVGSLLAFLGMVLFVAIVLADALGLEPLRQRARPTVDWLHNQGQQGLR
jgi:hypothetical protein